MGVFYYNHNIEIVRQLELSIRTKGRANSTIDEITHNPIFDSRRVLQIYETHDANGLKKLHPNKIFFYKTQNYFIEPKIKLS